MSSITQCPECGTRFKVSQAQLEVHQGTVRCGHCQATFNAMQNLYDNKPSPQLPLPIEQEEPEQLLAPHEETASIEAVSDSGEGLNEPATELETDVSVTDEFSGAESIPISKRKYRWPWVLGTFLLFIILSMQAAYFFRVELAAHLPGLKPALMAGCDLLNCGIPLPQNADLMSIESSELEADPQHANAITLNAILRNRATYAQEYPNLELTLTDTSDEVLARRTFLPAEYLTLDKSEALGLAPNREISIKLHLDTTDLKPTGYRLLLFYHLAE